MPDIVDIILDDADFLRECVLAYDAYERTRKPDYRASHQSRRICACGNIVHARGMCRRCDRRAQKEAVNA